MAGGMMLAFGIACGLNETRASGLGQVIDAAMIDAAGLLMHGVYGAFGAGYWNLTPGTNLLDSGAPFYDVYQCADGKWISLGPLEPPFYALLLEKLGLAGDPLFADQYDSTRWRERTERIAAIIRGKARDEWCASLEGSDCCFAPVLDIAETPQHPHHRARQSFIRIEGVTQPAPAPRFSRTPAAVRSPPAMPGEDADQALRDWGLDDGEIERLRGADALG
jgi:alpha-methylacyl-CoA racemase